MPRALLRGFTLIEVVITIALFAVLVLAITQLYLVFGRMISTETTSIGAALSANAIVEAAHVAGLEADHMVAAHTFGGTNLTAGTTTAIFELPAVDASGAPIANTYDYVGIYASSTSAYRVTAAAPSSVRVSGTKLLTGALNALSFSYDQPDFSLVASLTVDATTTATAAGRTTYTHLREKIYLRNR